VDKGSNEKSRSLEEQEGSNCPSHRVGHITGVVSVSSGDNS
jgi:hypothetical protein